MNQLLNNTYTTILIKILKLHQKESLSQISIILNLPYNLIKRLYKLQDYQLYNLPLLYYEILINNTNNPKQDSKLYNPKLSLTEFKSLLKSKNKLSTKDNIKINRKFQKMWFSNYDKHDN